MARPDTVTSGELLALTDAGGGHLAAPAAPRTDEPRLFGGLLVAQAILAASRDTRRCHALHALFIGVGEMEAGFGIVVERTRDGGSFATRRMEIRQGRAAAVGGLQLAPRRR